MARQYFFKDAGIPTITATYEGSIYVDTTAGNVYIAGGISSAADWVMTPTNINELGVTEDIDFQGVWKAINLNGIDYTAMATQAINAGVITPTQALTRIDTQASAPADDLDTIVYNGSNLVYLTRVDVGRAVTITSGVGNIDLPYNADVKMLYNTVYPMIYDLANTKWQIVAEANTDFVPQPNNTDAVINPAIGDFVCADPSLNNQTINLPALANGGTLFIKRCFAGDNSVIIANANINGFTGELPFPLKNSRLELLANTNNNTWEVVSSSLTAAATMMNETPTTYAVSTSWTKFTGFAVGGVNGFTSPAKLVPDVLNNQITLSNIRANPIEGFRISATIVGGFSNNQSLSMRISHSVAGVIVAPISVDGLGVSQPISFVIYVPLPLTANGEIFIEFEGQSANNFEVLYSQMSVETFT